MLRVIVPALVLGALASALLASGLLGTAFPGTVTLMQLALLLLTVLSVVAGYAKGRSRAWLAPLFEIGGISMLTALLLAGLTLVAGEARTSSVTIAFGAALLLLVLVAGLMVLRDMPRGLRLPPLEAENRAELHSHLRYFIL